MTSNPRPCLALSFALSVATLALACSSDDTGPSGSTGSTTGSTSSGGETSGSDSATSTGTGGATGSSGSTTDSGGSTGAGSEGSTGGPGFDTLGECRLVGGGMFQDGSYQGTEDLILRADEGNGDEICVVRFDLTTVAEPDLPCDFCYWSTIVERSNPTVITNVDDVCGVSERGLDQAGLDAMTGERIAMGFAEEGSGHGEVLVHFDEMTQLWAVFAFGFWDVDNSTLEYSKVEGFCRY